MSDTGPAKLPGLFALRTLDASLNSWAQAVNEHLEVRNGARGNTAEKAVVKRDLDAATKRLEKLEAVVSPNTTALVAKVIADPAFQAAVNPRTTTSLAPTPPSLNDEVASLRAALDALNQKVQGAGSEGGYGEGFDYVDPALEPVAGGGLPSTADPYWRLKNTVVMGGVTVKVLMDLLYSVFYTDQVEVHGTTLNPKLKVLGGASLLEINRNAMNPMGDGLSASIWIWRIHNLNTEQNRRLAAIEARLAAAGIP